MTKVPLTFTAEEAGAKLSLVSNNGPAVTLETSTTGEEGSWTPYEVGTEIVLANVGDKVMFRNSSDTIQVMASILGRNRFKIDSGKIAASGNIMFLMDKTGELRDLSGKDCCYQSMFSDCTSLTQAPELPATTLAYMCYTTMFSGCTSLTQAPELLATTLDYACYSLMFNNCISIPEPKYIIPNLSFDELVNAIQRTYIFDEFYDGPTFEVQYLNKKIVYVSCDFDSGKWTITEK